MQAKHGLLAGNPARLQAVRVLKLVRSRLLTVAVIPAVVLSPTNSAGQATTQRESFDVASIRVSQGGSARRLRMHPLGLDVSNTTALELIEFAFGVIERDVVGERPSWMEATRFDVAARTANGPLTPNRVRAMTRALLEDRFRLNASIEEADGHVYALVSAQPDGDVMGTMLRPSSSTCDVDAPLTDAERPAPVRVLSLQDACGFRILTDGGILAGLMGMTVTMQGLAVQLSRVGGFGRPVVDGTGLNGKFDMAIVPLADMVAPTSQVRFLMALREQGGLTLESEEGSYEVLRIRSIEQPSEN
jgi:uncharacterized protein (TIGR03435 family)